VLAPCVVSVLSMACECDCVALVVVEKARVCVVVVVVSVVVLGGGLVVPDFLSWPGARPTSMITFRASWSLPPPFRVLVLTTWSLSTLLKMLSMPSRYSPVWTCRRYLRNSCTVGESTFALKSPTKTIPSPSCPCSEMSCKMLRAVASPPQTPPVLIGRGPW